MLLTAEPSPALDHFRGNYYLNMDFIMEFLIFSIYGDWKFFWNNTLGWHLSSFRICSTPDQALFGFRVFLEKSGIVLVDLIYMSPALIFFQLLIFFFVLYISVLIMMWQGNFLFWFSHFLILYVSYTFIGISIYRLGNFSSMILLKILSYYS